MTTIFNFFGSIFGYVLWPIFYVVQNYGIAIIIFAILAKIVLFPFSIKQQKAMANNARLQKKQKEIQNAREALKTGDKVITAGGIYGRIREIGDIYMMIEVANGVIIRVDKTSIFASAEDAAQQQK